MQHALPLHDGHCHGPLFAPPVKRKPPKPKARGWNHYHQRHARPAFNSAATSAATSAARRCVHQIGRAHV